METSPAAGTYMGAAVPTSGGGADRLLDPSESSFSEMVPRLDRLECLLETGRLMEVLDACLSRSGSQLAACINELGMREALP